MYYRSEIININFYYINVYYVLEIDFIGDEDEEMERETLKVHANRQSDNVSGVMFECDNIHMHDNFLIICQPVFSPSISHSRSFEWNCKKIIYLTYALGYVLIFENCFLLMFVFLFVSNETIKINRIVFQFGLTNNKKRNNKECFLCAMTT